jgi:hypothetical protein
MLGLIEMKPLILRTTLAGLAFLMCCPRSPASLIDLTPGGFHPDAYPDGFQQFLIENGHLFTFFDEARVVPYDGPHGTKIDAHGWISLYGALNGGQFFFTDLFDIDPTPTAQIWWDFAGSGASLYRVFLWGRNADGLPWEHIYGIPEGDRYASAGLENVTLGAGVDIGSIAFYGRPASWPAPESGSTAALLVLALGGILGLAQRSSISSPTGSN